MSITMPNEVTETLSIPLGITDAALGKIRDLMLDSGEDGGEGGDGAPIYLRIFIEGGGCSGYKYQMTFDENQNPGDTLFEIGQVKIVIDPMSLPLLKGVKVDYREDDEGEQFVFMNPNAKTTCGCGSSFDT